MLYSLTPELIAKFDQKYLTNIIDNPHTFFDNLDMHDDINQHTLMYFTMHFVKGNLTRTPGYSCHLDDDHRASSDVLAELNREGVITACGQRSYNHDERQRSYLVSHIPLKDPLKINLLLDALFNKGLNVIANICKIHINTYDDGKCEVTHDYMHHTVMLQIGDKKIYKLKANESDLNDIRNYAYKHNEQYVTGIRSVWPIHTDDFIMGDLLTNSVSEYVMDLMIFNQNWDLLQADEILLQTLREFK